MDAGEPSTDAGSRRDDRRPRCRWAVGSSPELLRYHDREWGVPLHGESALLEMLTLEGAQAGLSWSTVLSRRPRYREAFAGFDPEILAGWGDADLERLLADRGLIRHRGKLASVIANARVVRRLHDEGSALDQLLWSSVEGAPLQPRYPPEAGPPGVTAESTALSHRLRQLGFKFLGPTSTLSLMQACGLTNDHTTDCYRQAELESTAGPEAGAS